MNFKLKYICLALFIACSCKENTAISSNKQTTQLQDSLAFELCRIYGSDQGIRDMKLITRSETGAMAFSPYLDSINFFKVLNFVKENGFPNEKILGKDNLSHECVGLAIIAVLLHTPHMLINNKKYLDVFLEEVNKGNMKMMILTDVLDKYYVLRRDEFGNRKLLYGSRFGKPCLKYRKQSDSARAVIGLPPLKLEEFKECN